MPVAVVTRRDPLAGRFLITESSIEADAADGNLDKWKVWIIIGGYTSTALRN